MPLLLLNEVISAQCLQGEEMLHSWSNGKRVYLEFPYPPWTDDQIQRYCLRAIGNPGCGCFLPLANPPSSESSPLKDMMKRGVIGHQLLVQRSCKAMKVLNPSGLDGLKRDVCVFLLRKSVPHFLK